MAERGSSKKKTAAKPKSPRGELSSDERWLLGRMGTHESAWAFRDTLVRAAALAEERTAKALDSLLKRGLLEREEAPAGPRYRLSEAGREAKAPPPEPVKAGAV